MPPKGKEDRPALPAVRVGDAERDRAAMELREHCVHGRLTLEEFSTRIDDLYRARTEQDLELALRELPALAPSAAAGRGKRRSWLLTIIGSVQRRGPWRVPRRVFAVSFLGAPDLDFRQAVIDDEEVGITSISLIGVVTAIVPAGVEVELGGLALVGGNDFTTKETVKHIPDGPRIRIRSFALLGGARIEHVR